MQIDLASETASYQLEGRFLIVDQLQPVAPAQVQKSLTIHVLFARLGRCMFFLLGKRWLGSKPGRVHHSRRKRANNEFKRLHGGARIVELSYC
jgi:hypothetical protein